MIARSVVPFGIMPSPRCCEITSNAPVTICNRPARWMPLIDRPGLTPFWCDQHKPETAVPAFGVVNVRRIGVVAQLVFGSALEDEKLARLEVLERLERGARSVGALLTQRGLVVQTGQWMVPPPPGSQNGNGGAG